jgi:DNA-binding MarR family transcriptional regulator
VTEPEEIQWEDVQKVLQGQDVTRVTVGQYVVHIGDVHGGVISIKAPEEKEIDRIRLRRPPPHVLLRPIPGFLDREREWRLISQALARGKVVDLHGPDGAGKTALISHLLHTQLPSVFPDGMVYLSVPNETYDDLLQTLFDVFFETDGYFKPTRDEIAKRLRQHMLGKRALIVLDDVNRLEPGEAETLVETIPQASFLIAGRRQQVWQAEPVALGGLPRDAVVELFERHWGRVTLHERPAVEAICDTLENIPLAIIQTAQVAASQHLPLSQVLEQLEPRSDPIAQARWKISNLLSEDERRVLAALAAIGGPNVDAEALAAITDLPQTEVTTYLDRLQEKGLVQSHSPRYSLDESVKAYLQQVPADEEIRVRAGDYYREQAEQFESHVGGADEANVLAAVDHYFRQEQWKQVVTLIRMVEPILVTTGRWRQWRLRLAQARRAAKELDDWATDAWAQNQLGLIALAAGDLATACRFFQGASAIQQAIGDLAGLKATKQNLELVEDMLPIDPTKGDRDTATQAQISQPVPGPPNGPTKVANLESSHGKARSGKAAQEPPYDVEVIRELLTTAFTHQSLRRFCQNDSDLRPVVNEFSPHHGLNDMVDRVIDYCWTQRLWDHLLVAIKEENPRQYANFEPHLRPSAKDPMLPVRDPLPERLGELRQMIKGQAPGVKRALALEKLIALKVAATDQPPALARMQDILRWFEAELPSLSGAVLSAILSVETRAERAGDEVLLEFWRRFEGSPALG